MMGKKVRVKAEGPFNPEASLLLPDLSGRVGGVYLWCVKNINNEYLIYYVGKSVEFRRRIRDEIGHFRNQEWTVHAIDKLKVGELEIVNVARKGLVEKYKDLNFDKYIEGFLDDMNLFFIRMPEIGHQGENQRSFEKAISLHVLGMNGNIMDGKESFGRLGSETISVEIDTGEHHVIGISGESIRCDRSAFP